MGNHRFKLSDMIPNSWLYKLKDMRKPLRNHEAEMKKTEPRPHQEIAQRSQSHQPSVSRKSYHFARDLNPSCSVSPSDLKISETRYFPIPNPPRRSANLRRTNPRKNKKKKKKPPRLVSSSVSAGCSCRATLDSVWAKTEHAVSLPETEYSVSPSSDSDSDCSATVDRPPELPPSFDQMVSWSTSCSCTVKPTSRDIVIDVGKSLYEPEVDLPPIATKPLKFTDMVKQFRRPEEAERPLPVKQSPARGFLVNSTAVRLRVSSNSPRTVLRQRAESTGRKSNVSGASSSSGGGHRRRRSVSDSFAVVKSSADPKRDFRESMVEMIVENNIRAAKDLEELLACYLSLNSDEYHDVIIAVFKQIWFDLTNDNIRLSIKS